MSTQFDSIAPLILGVDEAWDKLSADDLLSRGYRFVIGYLSPDRTGKNLTEQLVTQYLAAGLAVLPVWEFDPQAPLGGYTRGVSDATDACRYLQALGWPKGRSVYFAIDFDVTADQMPTVVQYMTATAEWCAKFGYRADAYGGYAVISELKRRGLIAYGWQTYAWSQGRWVPGIAIHQTTNGVHVASHVVDEDQAYVHDFGQWMPDGWSDLTYPGGFMDPQQQQQLADASYAVTEDFSLDDPTKRVPLQVWTLQVGTMLTHLRSDMSGILSQNADMAAAIHEFGSALQLLTAQVAQALAALGQQQAAEQAVLDIWKRVADALERLAPPPAPVTPAATAEPVTHPADSLS